MSDVSSSIDFVQMSRNAAAAAAASSGGASQRSGAGQGPIRPPAFEYGGGVSIVGGKGPQRGGGGGSHNTSVLLSTTATPVRGNGQRGGGGGSPPRSGTKAPYDTRSGGVSTAVNSPSPRGRNVHTPTKVQMPTQQRGSPLQQRKPLLRRAEENDEAMTRFYQSALAKQAAKTQWAQEEQAKRAERELQEDEAACTFQPQVSDRVASMRRPASLGPQHRIYDEQRLKRERLAFAAQHKDMEEVRGCTFRPITLSSAKVEPGAFAIRTDRHNVLYEHAMDRIAYRRDILPKAAEAILSEAEVAKEQQRQCGDVLFTQQVKQRASSPLVPEEVEDLLGRIVKHRSPQHERRMFLKQVERERAAKKRVQARNEEFDRRRSKSAHRDPHLGSEGRHLVRSHSRGKQHHPNNDHITDVSALTPSDGGRNGPTSSSMNTTTTDDGDDVLSPIPRRGADGDSSLDDSTYYKLNPHQVRINKHSDAVAKKRFGDQGPQDVVDRLLGLGKRGAPPANNNQHHHPVNTECTFTPRVSPGSAALMDAKKTGQLNAIIDALMGVDSNGSHDNASSPIPVMPLARAVLGRLAHPSEDGVDVDDAVLDAADLLVDYLQKVGSDSVPRSNLTSSVAPKLSQNTLYQMMKKLGISTEHHQHQQQGKGVQSAREYNKKENPKNNNRYEEPTFRPALSEGSKALLANRDEGKARDALTKRREHLEQERLQREEVTNKEYTFKPTINRPPPKSTAQNDPHMRERKISDDAVREVEHNDQRRRSGTQGTLREDDPPTLRGDVNPPFIHPAHSGTGGHFEDMRSFSPASTRAAPQQPGSHPRPSSQSIDPDCRVASTSNVHHNGAQSPSPVSPNDGRPPQPVVDRAAHLRALNERAQRALPISTASRRMVEDEEMPDDLVRDLQAAIDALNPSTALRGNGRPEPRGGGAALYPPLVDHHTHLPLESERLSTQPSPNAHQQQPQQQRRSRLQHDSYTSAREQRRAYISHLQTAASRQQNQQLEQDQRRVASSSPPRHSDGHYDALRHHLQANRQPL